MKRKNIVRLFTVIASITVVYSLLVKKVTLVIDGQEKILYTFASNYEKLLENRKINIDKNYQASPSLDSKISNNDKLVISKVIVNQVVELEDIPYEEKIVQDYKLGVGEERIISQGANGIRKMTYNVTYNDGVEVDKELVSEENETDPIEKVIAKGIFDPNSLTVCVNKNRYLSPSFEPKELVVPYVRMAASSSKNLMRPEAAKALESLFDAAEKEGVYLYAVSGYRSYNYQASIYNPYSGYSAPPGASEHQLGLAMDVNAGYSGTNLTPSFANTVEGKWIRDNAHKYGFVVRYMEGKEDITGYYYEPWHLRYLGVDLAKELTSKGITLEEYYGEY